MSEIQKRQVNLPEIIPVDWRAVKATMRERYYAEMKVETGVRITRRALAGKRQIVDDMKGGSSVDDMDVWLLQTFVGGAAQVIQDYMTDE